MKYQNHIKSIGEAYNSPEEKEKRCALGMTLKLSVEILGMRSTFHRYFPDLFLPGYRNCVSTYMCIYIYIYIYIERERDTPLPPYG